MKKLIAISISFLFIHGSSNAQSAGPRDKFLVGWEVGFPSNDFLSGTSYRGGKIEYQRMVKPNLSIGMSGSWNSFHSYVSKSTYQKPDGTGAITTDLVKELYSVPLTLNMKYHLKGSGKISPFAGVGLGAQFSQQTIHFNIYSIEDNTWGFVARPELGLQYAIDRYSSIYLSGTYNHATNKSDMFKTDNLSHFVLSLGYVFSN